MPAEIESRKIVYFPIPKTACTSVKQAFHWINFGHYHVARAGNHIHSAVYPTLNFIETNHVAYADWTRIAVIRDPVERMLSAYSSRVIDHGELAEDKINLRLARELMIGANPSPDEFFDNLDKYRVLDLSIRHHTDFATTFLGHDLAYYHRTYRVDQLDELFQFLSEQVGKEVKCVKEHSSAERVTFYDIGPRARQALKEYCYADYALMKSYYKLTL